MGVLPFRARRRSDERKELARLLHGAKSGDEAARNQLISSYVPFILRIASQTTHRYIDQTVDDEYSIALSAFNEAIDRFDLERESSFLSFAETIIRRRLIDFFRSRQRDRKQVPWSEFDLLDEEDNVTNYAEVSTSLAQHQLYEEATMRGYEIEEYQKRLQDFDLSFGELVRISPKHEDARQNAFEIGRVIAADEELLEFVERRKSLPLKQLEDRVHVSRKTMERQRKYILAVVVLLTGDFPLLQSFLEDAKEV
ncbi:RNA polymerase sigma factor SigI [Alicyclobacillus fastidiosus]|uniref:RNA polymerase sigma factor SigI n=1 Tax=Alicyclobacillus fastidiosus TaxID=392011 RepID=A0ABV5AK81_9BACL|nr:RNA polymerase sigma factor SigI [Alicyclobacillus fastidiosus]WEH11202.1 RNA polymerase sigma factor SigI [Alicyclobacillus fastidiosus]